MTIDPKTEEQGKHGLQREGRNLKREGSETADLTNGESEKPDLQGKGKYETTGLGTHWSGKIDLRNEGSGITDQIIGGLEKRCQTKEGS